MISSPPKPPKPLRRLLSSPVEAAKIRLTSTLSLAGPSPADPVESTATLTSDSQPAPKS